jgi:cation transport ATPase
MRLKGYPKQFYTILMLIITALFVTGCLLLPTTLNLKLEWDVPWRLSSDQHINMAAAHAILSLLMVGIIGALWSIHMRMGWKRRRNYLTGFSLLVIMVLLGVTAIGIYYLGGEQASVFSSVGHAVMGVAIPFVLAIHIAIARGHKVYH